MADNKECKGDLGRLVEFVSGELREVDARLRESDNEPVMRFLECEIDCAIEVEVKGDGGVHVWVVNLGAGAKRSETNTIKVKYSAAPSKELVAAVLGDQGQEPDRKPVRRSRKLIRGE